MKRNTIGLLVLVIFTSLIVCCEKNEGETTFLERVFVDGSIYRLNILVWSVGEGLIEFDLNSNEQLRFEGEEFEDLFHGYIDGLGWREVDSMHVIADDSLRVRYFQADSCHQRNPMEYYGFGGCYGYEITTLDGVEVETFTFTDEDFIYAEVIKD
jgi:hypothetical protein